MDDPSIRSHVMLLDVNETLLDIKPGSKRDSNATAAP